MMMMTRKMKRKMMKEREKGRRMKGNVSYVVMYHIITKNE